MHRFSRAFFPCEEQTSSLGRGTNVLQGWSIWDVEIWVSVNPKLLPPWRKCTLGEPLPAPGIQVAWVFNRALRIKLHYARIVSLHYLKYVERSGFSFLVPFLLSENWRTLSPRANPYLSILRRTPAALLFHPTTLARHSTDCAWNVARFHRPMKHHRMLAFVSTNRTAFLSQVPAQRKLPLPMELL